MTRTLKTLLLALTLFGLAACTSKPLLQPEVKLPAEREYSQVQLQQAIISALEARRWQVERVEPSQIQASINVRQRHLARISIDYSPFGFLIRYRDSQGLEYEDGIAFGDGLSAADEPAVLVRDLTGRLTKWVDVGMPSADRIHRASKCLTGDGGPRRGILGDST